MEYLELWQSMIWVENLKLTRRDHTHRMPKSLVPYPTLVMRLLYAAHIVSQIWERLTKKINWQTLNLGGNPTLLVL